MDHLPTVVDRRGRWTVVAPSGPLDVATAPGLRQRLREVQVPAGAAVVVDLDGVEYLDSIGLGVLIGALKRARETGGELVLRCTRERTLELLALTRLDTVLRVVDDVDAVVEVADGP